MQNKTAVQVSHLFSCKQRPQGQGSSLLPTGDDITVGTTKLLLHYMLQTQVSPAALSWKTHPASGCRAVPVPVQGHQSTRVWQILCSFGLVMGKKLKPWERQKAEKSIWGLRHPCMNYHHSNLPPFWCALANSLWTCRWWFLISWLPPVGNRWYCLLNLHTYIKLTMFVWNRVKRYKSISLKANAASSLEHMALYFLHKSGSRAAKQTQRQDTR